jgi:ADP-ribose pyrophosphatase YjhB (NUDIX family)
MNIIEYKSKLSLPLRRATLLFLVDEERILLAMKKRGFGVGRWNGVGGKPIEGESIDQTAIRETQEEIEVTPQNIEVVAILDFYFTGNQDWNQQVIAYTSKSWVGVPKETEEMNPKWYSKNSLPFDDMWPDDRIWLEPVVQGSKVKGEFLFGENDSIIDKNIKVVETLSI